MVAQYSGNESSCNLQHFGVYNVTVAPGVKVIGVIAEKIITFLKDKKLITKCEMKVRSRIRREVSRVDLHTGPES